MAVSDSEKKDFKPRASLQTSLSGSSSRFDDYEFFRRSYEGGSAYRDGDYLIQHAREKDEDYKNRKEQSSFVNFCGDVVDIYNSHLFKEEPKREFKSKSVMLDSFLEDADLEGRTWSTVMRELSKMAGYYGVMGAIIDKPQGNGEKSKGEEQTKGIRPYIAPYSPLSIWDWKYERIDGIMTLTYLLLEEDTDGGDPQVMEWTREDWKLWEKTGDESKYALEDSGINSLKEIPFILLRNRDSFKKMAGVSDISDIATVNRRIYFLDSDALEIIDNCAIPIFEGSIEAMGNKDQEVIVSTTSMLKRPEGGLGEGFRWIEAPHTSLAQILAWRNSAIADIKWMAKTGQGDAQKQTGESGVALELRFQQLSALLSGKAENAESFETKAFYFIGRWENSEIDATIEYPRKFGIRDMQHDLDTAIESKMVVTSPTFQAEIGKSFALKILPKDTDQKIIDKINDELDNPVEPVPGSEKDGEDEE